MSPPPSGLSVFWVLLLSLTSTCCGAWSPHTAHTDPNCHNFTSRLRANSSHTPMSSPDPNIQLPPRHLLRLQISKPDRVWLCLFPPSCLPPSFLHLSERHPRPRRLQPGSPSHLFLSSHYHPPYVTLPMSLDGFTFKAPPESSTLCHLHCQQPLRSPTISPGPQQPFLSQGGCPALT